MTFEDLEKALAVFGLGQRARLEEIKDRHRELVKRHHPDIGGTEPEKMPKVNVAYRIIMNYVDTYQFSFTEEEYCRQNPGERLRRQFKDDPLWGNGGMEKR